jgi:hypothetical protein
MVHNKRRSSPLLEQCWAVTLFVLLKLPVLVPVSKNRTGMGSDFWNWNQVKIQIQFWNQNQNF